MASAWPGNAVDVMNQKLDPGLKFLSEQRKTVLTRMAAESIFDFNSAPGVEPTASVLVEFEGEVATLEDAGLRVSAVAGDVVSGEVVLRRVDRLAELDEVRRIEVARAMHRDLDLALPEIRADAVHTGPPGHRGNGVIVGIIDSGIDFMHEAFRRPDMSSRILAIWDQGLVPRAGESSPAGFTYGVEYRAPQINAALAAPDPFAVVRHRDLQIPGDGFHGTHVAGIAAGDGSVAGSGQPPFTFLGVAPEADLVVVANTRGAAAGQRGLGDSADTLDAARYILDLAEALGRPVVINQSQGDNLGPHDGTSLLERGLDNLLGGTGRAMVKSAGNEGNRNRHASGAVPLGGGQPVQFTMPARTAPVTIDVWYSGTDRFDVTITPPGGGPTPIVSPGATTAVNVTGGNSVFTDSAVGDPGNGDSRIFIVLSRAGAATVTPGTWTITLMGTTVSNGLWDAWIRARRAKSRVPGTAPQSGAHDLDPRNRARAHHGGVVRHSRGRRRNDLDVLQLGSHARWTAGADDRRAGPVDHRSATAEHRGHLRPDVRDVDGCADGDRHDRLDAAGQPRAHGGRDTRLPDEHRARRRLHRRHAEPRVGRRQTGCCRGLCVCHCGGRRRRLAGRERHVLLVRLTAVRFLGEERR